MSSTTHALAEKPSMVHVHGRHREIRADRIEEKPVRIFFTCGPSPLHSLIERMPMRILDRRRAIYSVRITLQSGRSIRRRQFGRQKTHPVGPICSNQKIKRSEEVVLLCPVPRAARVDTQKRRHWITRSSAWAICDTRRPGL